MKLYALVLDEIHYGLEIPGISGRTMDSRRESNLRFQAELAWLEDQGIISRIDTGVELAPHAEVFRLVLKFLSIAGRANGRSWHRRSVRSFATDWISRQIAALYREREQDAISIVPIHRLSRLTLPPLLSNEREPSSSLDMLNSFADFLFNDIDRGLELFAMAERIVAKEQGISTLDLRNSNRRERDRLSETDQQTATLIVIDAMPQPHAGVDWERIIEFRKDVDSRTRLIELRRWIRNLSFDHRPIRESREHLEYLLNGYREHLRLHEIDFRTGRLEVCVTGIRDVVNDLMHFRVPQAKALFQLKACKIALMKAELSIPGREISYVAKVRRTFET